MKTLEIVAFITLLSKVFTKALNKDYDQTLKQDLRNEYYPYEYDPSMPSGMQILPRYEPLIDGKPIYVPDKEFMKKDRELISSIKDLDAADIKNLDSEYFDKLFDYDRDQNFKDSNLESDEVFIVQRSSEKNKPSNKEYKNITTKQKGVSVPEISLNEIDTKHEDQAQKSKVTKKYPEGCKASKKKVKKFNVYDEKTNQINTKTGEISSQKILVKLPDVNPRVEKSKPQISDASEGQRSLFQSEETVGIEKHLPLQKEVKNMFGPKFRSFVFNPNAPKEAKFQECNTSKNESGSCRYVQHCILPSIVSSIEQFMNNVCIIEGRFIGVCCPEFPVQTLRIKWKNISDSEQFSEGIKTPQDCGIGSNTRIVGGMNANSKAWPWMVALLNNKKKFFCGGSLINDRYVLTAAHCTFGQRSNEIIARVGEFDLSSDQGNHEDILVEVIKRHGQYNSFTLRNDIALLKLHKPVHFNEFVKTICFPDPAKSYTSKVATLAGWGRTQGGISAFTSDVLQEASFPVLKNEECSSLHNLQIPPSLICTAAPAEDKGACNGDSGGPLMMLDDEDRWKIIGLVSWGRRGCSTKFPSVFTRVSHYFDWIKQHAV